DEQLAVLPDLLREPLAIRPYGLTEEEHRRALAAVPRFEEMCRALAADGVPETIQHDDLHDGQAFVRDGRYLVFDWGDSCVSHPFHSLTVILRSIAFRLDLPPGGPELRRLRDGYLEPFGHGPELADLRRRRSSPRRSRRTRCCSGAPVRGAAACRIRSTRRRQLRHHSRACHGRDPARRGKKSAIGPRGDLAGTASRARSFGFWWGSGSGENRGRGRASSRIDRTRLP